MGPLLVRDVTMRQDQMQKTFLVAELGLANPWFKHVVKQKDTFLIPSKRIKGW